MVGAQVQNNVLMNPNEGILMKTSLCYMVKKINVDHISIKGFILPDSFHCFKKNLP